MDKIEEKELEKLLKEVKRLYKKHLKEGYEYSGVIFEDCLDGYEVQEVLIFHKQWWWCINMEKIIEGEEGDTTLYYSNEGTETITKRGIKIYDSIVKISLEGQVGYLRKIEATPNNMKLIYNNPFYNTHVEKEIKITPKEFEKLENMKPTNKTIHKVLEKYFEKAGIESIND